MAILELIAKDKRESRQRKENKNYNPIGDTKYSTFAEQFLERPVLPKTDMLGEYASIPHPTFCTWKGIPTIDDADLLD